MSEHRHRPQQPTWPTGAHCLNCGATIPKDDRWFRVLTDNDLEAVDLCDGCFIERQIDIRCAWLDRGQEHP